MMLVGPTCPEGPAIFCIVLASTLFLPSLADPNSNPIYNVDPNANNGQNGWNIIIHNPVETVTVSKVEVKHQLPKIGAFELVAFHWDHVRTPLMIAIWVVVASCAKLLFHASDKFANNVPDSACLILSGLLVGLLFWSIKVDITHFTLTADTFFLYLLPPIIFGASYVMPMRLLFDNFDSVFLFSFFGTIFNAFTIGGTLIYFSHLGFFTFNITIIEALLFGSLISAVDPIAVIAVFEQIHVNDFIFINVFGEALFNDGVSLVLYLMFSKFHDIGEPNIHAAEYAGGAVSIVVIAVGGIFIGIFFGFLASYITKYTYKLKILAPGFIFVFPYIAYLTAEMFEWSAILATVSCGMVLKQYVTGSLSYEASSSVKYAAKFLSDCSETVVFVFLGLSTVYVEHGFDPVFIIVTVLSCLVFRTIGVIIQCGFLNIFRAKKFSARDQFILSYGGLRGAIAYGLAVSLPASVAAKNVFVTTTIAVIYFTVFIQGTTVKPLLAWLHIEKKDESEDSKKMMTIVGDRNLDFTMAGVEAIIGHRGHNFIREKIEHINSRWLKPIFTLHYQKKSFDDSQLRRAFGKAAIHDAILSADRSFMTPRSFVTSVDARIDTPALENVINEVLDKKFGHLAVLQGLSPLPGPERTRNVVDLPDNLHTEVPRPMSIRVHDVGPSFLPAPQLMPLPKQLPPKVQFHSSTFIN